MDAKNEKERKKESATNEQHPNEKPDHVKKSIYCLFLLDCQSKNL